MSVSSISSTQAPLPFNYLDKNTQPAGIVSAVTTPDNGNDNTTNNNDAGATQTLPPTPAPLPPGQGTRVDQLV